MTEREIKMQIEEKIPSFTSDLIKGKHIEIHMARDNNIKIFVVDKKTIK